jgi:hypothetical protein
LLIEPVTLLIEQKNNAIIAQKVIIEPALLLMEPALILIEPKNILMSEEKVIMELKLAVKEQWQENKQHQPILSLQYGVAKSVGQ